MSNHASNIPLQRDATPASRLRAPELERWAPLMTKIVNVVMACVALVSTTICHNALAQENSGKSFTLSPLKEEDFTHDCGCYFYLGKKSKSTGPHIAWTSSDPLIRIDGSPRTLKFIKEKWTPSNTTAVGDKFIFQLADPNTQVLIQGKVVGVCPVEPSECESVSLEGEMTVTVDKKNRSFVVNGLCGC